MFLKKEKEGEIIFSRRRIREDAPMIIFSLLLFSMAFYLFHDLRVLWGIVFFFYGTLIAISLIPAKEDLKTLKIYLPKEEILLVNEGGREFRITLAESQFRVSFLAGARRHPGFSNFGLLIEIYSNATKKPKNILNFRTSYPEGIKLLREMKDWLHEQKKVLNLDKNGDTIVSQEVRYSAVTIFIVVFILMIFPLNFLYKHYFFTPVFLNFFYRPLLFLTPLTVAFIYTKLKKKPSLRQIYKKIESQGRLQ